MRLSSPSVSRPSHGGLLGSLGLAVALMAAIVGVAVAILDWSGRLHTTGGEATAVAPPPRNPTPSRREPPALTVSGLGSLVPGRYALTAAPPFGGYGSLDVLVQLPWALTIAQGWAADARLERIDVTRLRPDGTVNAADDVEASVRYRFFSPHAAKVLLARRQTSTRARATTSFWVEVAQSKLVVMALENAGRVSADPRVPPHPEGLPLTSLVPRLQRLPQFRVPFLEGYLLHLDDEGWVWYLSPLSGESLQRVRASDGRPWPYTRPLR